MLIVYVAPVIVETYLANEMITLVKDTECNFEQSFEDHTCVVWSNEIGEAREI